MAKSNTSRDQAKPPFGDVMAKVRGDKPGDDGKARGDRLIKVGAVWETENGHFEFTLEAEPIAWSRAQPGFAFPQLRSFIIIARDRS
jgi:hypothetical protein